MLPSSQNLVLVGMRACGKTTLGRVVAERLQRPFVDLDDELGRRAGRPADEVLASEGEPAFRQREQDVLLWAATLRGTVIATGGGAVLHRDAFGTLARPSVVVYLELPAAALAARAALRPQPPLTALPLRAEVESLLAERGPLYRRVADITIRADGPDPILALLDRLSHEPPDGS